ncbi:Eukaryotic peptide chain release factor GTP-binding subunit [Ceratocystis platani]|uniref:Elongation factor 1-alpha n=1 Tax=Ceratocystis fimbriata f. sp. platani TaxID=88771 RepID=A0A0F8B4X6_CERFI|nr:Eukaryotic peptide chain release factor GTP-binding subunit [Ceratocystis platani]
MSNPNDENLARQAQQMNLNQPQQQQQPAAQAPTFRPGGASFQPGASSFTPGASSFTPGQYGNIYGQYGNQQQGGYYQQQGGYYPQYGQGGGYQNQGNNYNQYNQGGYNNQQYAQYGQQQYQQQHRNNNNNNSNNNTKQNAPAPAPTASASSAPSAPKVLSIGGDSKPKVLSIGGDAKPKVAKVLSLGTPAAAKEEPKEETKKEEPKEEPKKEEVKKEEPQKEDVKKEEPKKEAPAKTAAKKTANSASGSSTPVVSRQIDAVEKEQTADVDQETLEGLYGKEHVNIIFIGHVDAGKSTLGGSILYATGMVDERTMDKYKREAKELGRETWYLSWALDLTKEERSAGKTVEVGRAYFETEKRRYSILDAPGHKTYVPSMIGGASQADVGILVISARKGEYETGFERGGQTREHAMLAKTQGVNKLIVVINKMDDSTVEWSEDRFKECTTKLSQFLKATGYNLKTDVFIMPVAAQIGAGIKERVDPKKCPWYSGPSLLEYLDNMKSLDRKLNAPFMMSVNGKYRDLGTMVEGKIEAGVIKKNMSLVMMPNKQSVEVSALYTETEDEVQIAQCGEQVRVRLRNIEEEEVQPGFVLCSPKRLVHNVASFEAQIKILELKTILTSGFNCVLHVHAAIEEVTFDSLLHSLQKGTNRRSKKPPTHAKKGDSIIARLKVIGGVGSVCVEKFEDYAQMGRFTLRDQGQTIAIGKIIKLCTDE